ncbi:MULTISPECIES: hypothetical protein [Frankia]|nr:MULTISPECIES: hypothetical protein [Frankia]
MATANHYLIDIAAGWALLGVAALAVRSPARHYDPYRANQPINYDRWS